MRLLINALIVLIIIAFTAALNEDSVKERRCSKVPVSNHDIQWALTAPKFYFPKSSGLHLYRAASTVSRKPEQDIREDDLYYNSCIRMTWEADGAELLGFGRSRRIPFNPVGQNTFEYNYGDADGAKKNGTFYLTLTDNRTFLLFTTCWGDDEMSWAVASTTSTLRPKTNRQIEKHLISQGFREEYFTSINYDSCRRNVQNEEDYPI